MNYLDIVLGSLLLFGLVRGCMKGLLLEVASLVAFIVGLYCAIHFSFMLSEYLHTLVSWEQNTINLVAFAITFLAIVVAIYFLGKLLTKLAKAVALGVVNRILGGIFGFLKVGLILSALLLFFTNTNNMVKFTDNKIIEESVLYEPVSAVGKFIFLKMIENGTIKQGEEPEPKTTAL